jgi:hypothetical protein
LIVREVIVREVIAGAVIAGERSRLAERCGKRLRPGSLDGPFPFEIGSIAPG